MLINTQTLSQHLPDPAWVVFDCRHDLFDLAKGERQYREGHIPGAHYASVETDLSGDKNGDNGGAAGDGCCDAGSGTHGLCAPWLVDLG